MNDYQKARAAIEYIANGSSIPRALEFVGLSSSKFTSLRAAYPELAGEYSRAQLGRADLHADEILDIADDVTADPAHNRNRIEARKWHASKMNARVYGERIDVNLQGSIDLGAIVREARQRLPSQPVQDIEYTEVPRIGVTDSVSVPSIFD